MDSDTETFVTLNVSRLNSDVISLEDISNRFDNSDNDSTDILDHHNIDVEISKFPLIPTYVLIAYLVGVNGIGILFNLFIVGRLLKKTINGIYSLLLPMAVTDILSLTIVGIPEMWSHHGGSWSFGYEVCFMYLGGEVFVGTSNVYFLIVFTFHAIATVNMLSRNNHTKKESEEELLEDITEMKSSRHSLVSRCDDSTSKTTSSSKNQNKPQLVPVVIPIVLVWVLAASLSVPEFTLATLIKSKAGPTICTFADGNRMTSMQVLLCIFQLAIPFVILLGSSLAILYKFKITSKGKDFQYESKNILKMSLFLCSVYFVLNMPRALLASAHMWSEGQEQRHDGRATLDLDHFRIPPLNNQIVSVAVPFVLSFLHFFAPVIKPLIYIYFGKQNKDNIFQVIKCQNQEL